MKYNFQMIGQDSNPFIGLIIELNEATNGFWVLALLGIIFIVSLYSFLQVTNDTGKSFMMSFHILALLSVLLYYTGKVAGYVIVNDLMMLMILTAEALIISSIYYNRVKT